MKQRMSRTILPALMAVIVFAIPSNSFATIFGQVSTAYTLEPGTMDVGGFVSVFESSALAFGQYRRGIMSNADFGVQAGFVDPEVGDMGLALGADVKFLLMRTGADTPFDLALDPRFSYLNLDAYSLVSIGGSVVISRDYALESGSLAPYGAFNMRLENSNWDESAAPGLSDGSDSDFEMSGIAGARWDITELLDILGEIVFDRDIGFTIGMNFKL